MLFFGHTLIDSLDAMRIQTILFVEGICASFSRRFYDHYATLENSRTVRFVDIKIAKSTLQDSRPKL